MAKHTAEIRWRRDSDVFTDNRYKRAHTWRFDGGLEVPASSSPHVVRVPYSDPCGIDPEEAFVAALSSCHMLWFLDIASQRGFRVDRYVDHATGEMGKLSAGRAFVKRVVLCPEADFSGDLVPSKSELTEMHEEAHNLCFIANSVKTEVVCEPVFSDSAEPAA